MLTVNKYRNTLLNHFYLDSDDLTIRRNKDGWRDKYKKHDIVKPYRLCSYGYGGIHIPGTRTSVSYAHLVTLLRGINIPNNRVIDHFDGNDTNDIRSNLRIVTQSINCKNSVMPKNNTSGYTGISWNKAANCYIVRKYIKGIRVYGGSAKTIKKAKIILDRLEILSFKDGYTTRHGKSGATTIPKGSTLKQVEAPSSLETN